MYNKFATQHYANFDSRCGQDYYEIIKYFPTNNHNSVVVAAQFFRSSLTNGIDSSTLSFN